MIQVAKNLQSSPTTAMDKQSAGVKRILQFLWDWGPFARNKNRPEDKVFFNVWNISQNETSVRGVLSSCLCQFPPSELPTFEEEIRVFLRQNVPPVGPSEAELASIETTEKAALKRRNLVNEAERLYHETAEEAWKHVPDRIRYQLAAMNAEHLERKLRKISEKSYHPKRGVAQTRRSRHGIEKIFHMWRKGFQEGVSLTERISIQVFFWFLLFCNIFPNVAAGFLGDREYNVRQTGARVFTFIQWCYLFTFDFPVLWVLFNWSLERLIGALLGNFMYALAALSPAVHHVYFTSWFRIIVLVLSTIWQISVQFFFPVRDIVSRLLTRRQMKLHRKKAVAIDWDAVDLEIKHELLSIKAFRKQQADAGTPHLEPDGVPLKVRIERYIQFSNTFRLGRSADMLVGLHKDDLENMLYLFEDYRASAPRQLQVESKADAGHAEPRFAKFLLVFFDVAIFAYVCYSFWHQPFTFNTVVAYGAVVIIKQTILALRRYQTVKSARRLFTNMTSFNIWGIFLLSVPVTVNENVLNSDGVFAGLLLAMVFTTVFLSEPLAPLFQVVGEKTTAGCSWLVRKTKRPTPPVPADSREKSVGSQDDGSTSEKSEVGPGVVAKQAL